MTKESCKPKRQRPNIFNISSNLFVGINTLSDITYQQHYLHYTDIPSTIIHGCTIRAANRFPAHRFSKELPSSQTLSNPLLRWLVLALQMINKYLDQWCHYSGQQRAATRSTRDDHPSLWTNTVSAAHHWLSKDRPKKTKKNK